MAHLGADLAAFVDGQLPEASADAVRRHLETCDACSQAVRQQRLLKSRMRSADAPPPPASLLASLSRLEHAPPPPETRWQRLLGSTFVRASVAVVGASLAIVAAAYAVGGTEHGPGDPVVPSVDVYAAQFVAAELASADETSTDEAITVSAMNKLDESGWPCHERLAGSFQRVDGRWTDADQVVKLSYTDGSSRLSLFEQSGRLDTGGLDDFTTARVSGADVWIRDGFPLVATWDNDGVVYTLVTDAGHATVARAVAQLPTRRTARGPAHRIADGLDRMASWVSPAA